MSTELLLPTALLAFTFFGSVWLWVHDRRATRLQERLAAAGAPEAVIAAAAAAAATSGPSIRTTSVGRLSRAIGNFLLLPVDSGMVSRFAPKLVLLACAIAAGAVLMFAGPRWGWQPSFIAAPLIFLGLARLVFGWERRRWRARLFEQVPDLIGLVCGTVRSGIPLSEAIRSVTHELASPSREQFARVSAEISIGQPLEGALWRLHDRTGLTEYAFLAVTMGLHAQTGGSLMEPLENLQEMVRRRVAVAKRGKALAAEARASAVILEALPFVAGAAIEFVNPGHFAYYTDTPGGQYLLLIAVVLFVLGVVCIQTLIRRSLSE